MSNITIKLVYNNGSVDEVATLEACEHAIQEFIVTREAEQSTVACAINAVFDNLNGARANMPYVISQTLLLLKTCPNEYKTIEKRIGDYIRSHQGTRESGAEFSIAKGKGGGVCRWVDVSETSDKK